SACRSVGTGKNGAQPGSRGDSKLGKYPVQVIADRSMRQIEPPTDLLVRKALGGELRNMKLLRGKRFPRLFSPPTARFTRCTQFPPRVLTPRQGSRCVEDAPTLTQGGSRTDGPALTAHQTAIGQ